MRKTMMAALAAMTLFTGTANAFPSMYEFCMRAGMNTAAECTQMQVKQDASDAKFKADMAKSATIYDNAFGKGAWERRVLAPTEDTYEQGYEDGYNAHRDETR